MTIDQMKAFALTITGNPAVVPTGCKEVDTEFKCIRCANVSCSGGDHGCYALHGRMAGQSRPREGGSPLSLLLPWRLWLNAAAACCPFPPNADT